MRREMYTGERHMADSPVVFSAATHVRRNPYPATALLLTHKLYIIYMLSSWFCNIDIFFHPSEVSTVRLQTDPTQFTEV